MCIFLFKFLIFNFFSITVGNYFVIEKRRVCFLTCKIFLHDGSGYVNLPGRRRRYENKRICLVGALRVFVYGPTVYATGGLVAVKSSPNEFVTISSARTKVSSERRENLRYVIFSSPYP